MKINRVKLPLTSTLLRKHTEQLDWSSTGQRWGTLVSLVVIYGEPQLWKLLLFHRTDANVLLTCC